MTRSKPRRTAQLTSGPRWPRNAPLCGLECPAVAEAPIRSTVLVAKADANHEKCPPRWLVSERRGRRDNRGRATPANLAMRSAAVLSSSADSTQGDRFSADSSITLWMSLRSGSLHSAPPLCIGQRPDRRSEDDRNATKWTAREARAVGSRTGRGQDRANHPQDGAGRSPSGGEAFHWGGQADAPRPVHRDYSTTHSTKQQCEVSRSRGR